MEVDGRKLENVRMQTYLGVILSEDGRMECELEKRIGAALSTVGAVRSQVCESRELSRSAKMLAGVQGNDRAYFDVWRTILGTNGEGEKKNSDS